MMKPHDHDDRERDVFIYFETAGGAYAAPVSCVREIADTYSLTLYPEGVSGHFGIVSLRGQVLPVVSPRLCDSDSTAQPCAGMVEGAKLLVLEFSDEACFCLPVQRVRKVLVPRDDVASRGVINIQGRPVRIVEEADLEQRDEVAA